MAELILDPKVYDEKFEFDIQVCFIKTVILKSMFKSMFSVKVSRSH